MKIYAMTATFGKLENQTLEFQPGLNIISAPNEWGKSTWCAFLATMLYGLETREKTTKTVLAAKERYAPWSGSPMAGRIDLNWNDRDITIERWTKGRTPLGEFRAYETESGLPIPELTGANCGQTLLGVEKSVFLRAGFLRLADLPVTEDEALRRRLNALVTTGDESGTGDLLAQKLRDLKNKCRSNRSNGLIPQAEGEKAALEAKLSELQAVKNQCEAVALRQKQLESQIADLENHKIALQHAASQEDLRRIEEAQQAAAAAKAHAEAQQAQCACLPSRSTAKQMLEQLQSLQQRQQNLQMEVQLQPQPPQPPVAPPYFYGLTGQKAIDQANTDIAEYHALNANVKKAFPLWLPAAVAAILGAVLLALQLLIPGILLLVAAVIALAVYIRNSGIEKSKLLARAVKLETLRARYGNDDPRQWLAEARLYAQRQAEYEQALNAYQRTRHQLDMQVSMLNADIAHATKGTTLHGALEHWKHALQLMDDCDHAQEAQKQAAAHAEAIQAIAKPIQQPQRPDYLTFTEDETARLLTEAAVEQKQLQTRLGQYQGRMEALGAEAELKAKLEVVNTRLEKLNTTYHALEVAMATLEDATIQLQRRFAPRIAQQAQELFCRLTGGRYDRLQLQQDLSVHAGAEGETVLHNAQWRSEGTADQLYLALRLAVARELTPASPLILDDALVRFDDVRHAAAMQILRQEAESKQIILFTCQSREQ